MEGEDKLQQYKKIIRENNAIIDALCKEYNSMFLIRYNSGKYTALNIADKYKFVLDTTDSYEEGLAIYCERYIHPKHREKIKEFASLENIANRLLENEIVESTYQNADNSWLNARYIEITPSEKSNEGRIFLLGIIKYNREMQELQYEKQANEVISVLSETYEVVYRINAKTGEYENILTKTDIRKHKSEYENAFDMEKFYNENYVKKAFVGRSGEELEECNFSIRRLDDYFEKDSEPVEIYLMECDGRWIKLYVAKDRSYSEESPYIILAIKESNEQIINRTRSIVNRLAIAKMYRLAVLLDVENDSYECIHNGMDNILPQNKGSLDTFLDTMRERIYEEDFDKFLNLFYDIESIADDFAECEFRAEDRGGMFHYVNGFTTYISVPDGGKMLFLLRYVDESVANREKINALNHDYNVARKMILALGEVYYAVYYVKAADSYMLPVRQRADVAEFHIKDRDYRKVLEMYINNMVALEDRTKVKKFASYENFCEHLHKEGDEVFIEYRRIMNGSVRWVRMETRAIKAENNVIEEVVVAFKDIHDERRNEILKKQALTDALENARAANKAKTEFLSSMSHDIRTPMNAVMGMTEIAIRHFDDREKVKSCLVRIEESSKHLLRLVNEVLDMSYIESGRTIINSKPFSIKKVIESIISITQGQIKEEKQHLFTEFTNIRSDKFFGDEVRIKQIVINVIGNAVKYTPDGGDIFFTVEQKNDICPTIGVFEFKIRDTGRGMSKEFLEKVFKPFEREHNSITGKTEGTGLGMTISKELTEMMGGTISVESEEGKGSTFTIMLPFKYNTQVSVKDNKTCEDTDGSDITLQYDFSGKRILVVDDNEINRDIACDFLDDVNSETDSASNGMEAYRKIADGEKYDAILMDIRMPEMSGYEATMKIRKLNTEYAEKVPIIAMTANAFVEDEMESRQAGMNEHITKPIDCEILYKTLNRLMSHISE